MKNRGSTPVLTNLVGVHPRNIYTKSMQQIHAAVREKKSKNQKVHAADDNDDNDDDNDNDDGYRVVARVTLTC